MRKRQQKKDIKSLKERLAEAIDMPKDILSDCGKITVYNDNQMIVENYKGIIEYTEKLIRIKIFSGVLNIEGNLLTISAVTDTDVLIDGKFLNVRWE